MNGTTLRRWETTVALVAGAGTGAAAIANAASDDSSAQTVTPAFVAGSTANGQQPQNPAELSHGPGEKLLSGSTAAKVRKAALAAVPGATVIRVETGAGSATYEAPMGKADGSTITVLLNSSFKVTDTVPGFGGPGGEAPPSDGPGA